jgi:hypothetical protein
MAELRAREMQLDMLSGHFDSTLAKYKPDYAIAPDEPEITPKITPNLEELWQQYVDARKVGKSPSTLRMYEWMANHIQRCPYKEPIDAQHIFDWVTSNVPRNSAKRVMMHLTACCSWAKKTGLLELANPFEGMAANIKLQKAGTDEDEIHPFTREERDWSNFTTRAWQTVLESLPDIEYRNPYQTRHTFCSLCREMDIPSIQIAKWVGNSAQMIDRVYAKPTDNIQVPEL